LVVHNRGSLSSSSLEAVRGYTAHGAQAVPELLLCVYYCNARAKAGRRPHMMKLRHEEAAARERQHDHSSICFCGCEGLASESGMLSGTASRT
jgi:hypothetical protein